MVIGKKSGTVSIRSTKKSQNTKVKVFKITKKGATLKTDQSDVDNKNYETCSLCADRIRRTRWTQAKCSSCQNDYHRSCVSFLPSQESGTHITILCPACRFVADVSPGSMKNRSPEKPFSQVIKAAESFLLDGFYIFPSPVISPGKLKGLRCFVDSFFEEHWRAFKSQSIIRSINKGFSNFRQRSPGRYEIVHPGLYEYITSMSVSAEESCEKRSRHSAENSTSSAKPIWMPILQCLLGENLRLLTSGIFLAQPGAKNQPFHTDGPAMSADFNLPCHAINLFVPLVKAGTLNGTQIQPGTQVSPQKQTIRYRGELDIPEQTRRKSDEKHVIPEVAAGGAYIFDYRVRHRGLANLTKKARPCLYFTFTRDWYSDTENFSSKRYSCELPVAFSFPDKKTKLR